MKKAQMEKKVLVFGTFDGIHPGHIFFLKEAAKLGLLTVVIASDEVVKEKKGKIPKPTKERIEEIRSLKIAKNVIIGDTKTRCWITLKEEKPDIIAVGYDQNKFVEALKRDKKIIGFDFKIIKIKSFKPKLYHSSILNKKDCVYCTIPEIKKRTIIENKYAWAFPTNIPIVPGHILISPKRCVAKFEDMKEVEVEAVFNLLRKLKTALTKTFKSEGFNIAWNEGEFAGQSVPHFHLHVLPRKSGDTGITKYEPRKFLYRPGSREKTPEKELLSISRLIQHNI